MKNELNTYTNIAVSLSVKKDSDILGYLRRLRKGSMAEWVKEAIREKIAREQTRTKET